VIVQRTFPWGLAVATWEDPLPELLDVQQTATRGRRKRRHSTYDAAETKATSGIALSKENLGLLPFPWVV
jgi:hypothetical protein